MFCAVNAIVLRGISIWEIGSLTPSDMAGKRL